MQLWRSPIHQQHWLVDLDHLLQPSSCFGDQFILALPFELFQTLEQKDLLEWTDAPLYGGLRRSCTLCRSEYEIHWLGLAFSISGIFKLAQHNLWSAHTRAASYLCSLLLMQMALLELARIHGGVWCAAWRHKFGDKKKQQMESNSLHPTILLASTSFCLQRPHDRRLCSATAAYLDVYVDPSANDPHEQRLNPRK